MFLFLVAALLLMLALIMDRWLSLVEWLNFHQVYFWGDLKSHTLPEDKNASGSEHCTKWNAPRVMKTFSTIPPDSVISCGVRHFTAITQSNDLWTWGSPDDARLPFFLSRKANCAVLDMKLKLTVLPIISPLMSYLVVWHTELNKLCVGIIGHFYFWRIWILQESNKVH